MSNHTHQSVAYWPTGTTSDPGDATRDNHYSQQEAQGVCNLLLRNGFGGDRKVFPLRVEVVALSNPTEAQSETPEIDAEVKLWWGDDAGLARIPPTIPRIIERSRNAIRAKVAELTKERDALDGMVEAKSTLLSNIADTLRSRGFDPSHHIDERVIELAQAFDALRRENEQLREDKAMLHFIIGKSSKLSDWQIDTFNSGTNDPSGFVKERIRAAMSARVEPEKGS